LRVFCCEEKSEEGDVFTMFAERWDRDGDDVEAVVEVLAKFPGLDGLLEIFVGRG